MVFEKIAQPDSADDVARVVYSRRPAAEAARVNNSRHTCCCIYFSKTISLSRLAQPALLLHGVHLFDLGDGGRVFGGFIFADEADDAGKTQRESGAAFVARASMNGRARDLVGEHGHDVLRLDPDVGDEARIHARRFIGGRRLVDELAQTHPILFAQSAAHFADGFEAIRLFIVDGGQQGPDAQPRPHPAPPQVADYRHVNRVAQLASVGAFELDPVEVSRPGLVARVEALGDDAFQPALYLIVKEFLKLGCVFGYYAVHQSDGQADAPGRFGGFGRFGLGGLLEESLEGCAPRSILLIDVILSVGVEQVEGYKDKRELARHLFDLIFALALRSDLKRMELACGLVDNNNLALDYRASSPDARHDRLG